MANFTYLDDEEQITYDAPKALNTLSGTIDTDISNICKLHSELIETLNGLQDKAHDVEGTSISEDYKDFQALLGEGYSLTGIAGYMNQANQVCVGMYDTISAWQQTTQK